MSWDKHHDYRMQDLKVLGSIAAEVIEKDSVELKKLREENEYLKSSIQSRETKAFASGVACCVVVFVCIFVFVFAYRCVLFLTT